MSEMKCFIHRSIVFTLYYLIEFILHAVLNTGLWHTEIESSTTPVNPGYSLKEMTCNHVQVNLSMLVDVAKPSM